MPDLKTGRRRKKSLMQSQEDMRKHSINPGINVYMKGKCQADGLKDCSCCKEALFSKYSKRDSRKEDHQQ